MVFWTTRLETDGFLLDEMYAVSQLYATPVAGDADWRLETYDYTDSILLLFP